MRFKILAILILIIPGFTILTAQKPGKKYFLSGVVTDVNQKPVQGAIIFIDNNSTGSNTDEKGYYKVKVKPDASIISIITLNGGMYEIPIEGRTVVNFTIKGSGQTQNTIQNNNTKNEDINVGYGNVKKGDLITPVGKIDGQNPKYASYASIYDMIRGEIPGVQVTGTSITIQGPSSINLSSTPLFVVDGIVVNSIDDIRPQFVKSIEILKGSSASIYGSRGTNGVILISLIGTEKK